jgi:hypothetical protein
VKHPKGNERAKQERKKKAKKKVKKNTLKNDNKVITKGGKGNPTGNVFDEEKPSKGSNERKPKDNQHHLTDIGN